MACFFVLFCFDLCVHSITSQSCLILHLCMMFLIVRNVEGIILKKKGSTHGTHTHTSSLYTFWSCSWRGVADGGSQLFHTKLALGRHVCTKRLTITCKHTLANTHRHIWAGPHAHQAPSWSFMGSLFHLPQGHQVTLIQREAKLATVGHTPGSAQGANYAWVGILTLNAKVAY